MADGERSPLLQVPDVESGRPRSNSCNVDHFDHEGEKGFGDKTITFWGSFCLNLNNCMGPAMVTLPLVNQQAGWLFPVIWFILLFALSSYSATMLCEAMQRIPGNHNFAHRYEFAPTVLHYFGRKAYIAFQILYNLSLQATNIAAMIISAQVVDQFVQTVAGGSYALDYQSWPPKFIKSTDSHDYPWCTVDLNSSGACPDGHELQFLISIGFIVCMVICIPFGYLNLDENMWFQWLSLAGLVVFTCEFFVQFIINFDGEDKICLNQQDFPDEYHGQCSYEPGNKGGWSTDNGLHRTPAFVGDAGAQAQVLGIAVFSYAYIVTIPSWVNEKKHNVNINKAIWWPAAVGLVMKILSGLLGGWAYSLLRPDNSPREDSDDILNILVLRNQPKVTQYSAYLWDITTLIPGIPVLAIMVRYNLLSGNICNRFWSFFWAVVAPWIVTAFCYETGVLITFCNWVAIVVQGYINFVIPVVLYRTALKRYPVFPPPEAINSKLPALENPVHALPERITLGKKTFQVNRILAADCMAVFFTVASTAAIIINIYEAA